MRLEGKRLEIEGILVENPYVNHANIGLAGDQKYVIEASWWRKWCDYVNFTQVNERKNRYNYDGDLHLENFT